MAKNIIRRLARNMPSPVKHRLLRIINWRNPHQRNVSWVRKTARHIQGNFSSELIFCPNGDVFERDQSGAEFLVPVHLADRLKIGISTFESVELNLLLGNLKAGDVLLDVGAHVGFYAVKVGRTIPNSQVYAFEPVLANFQVLQKNVARNHLEARIQTHKLAVGQTDGMVQISSAYGSGNFIVPSRVKRTDLFEEVESVALDSFIEMAEIKTVAAIKCDVEGYELNVLRGAQHCLASMRPIILIESFEKWSARFDYHPLAVFQMMQSFDYRWVRITHQGAILPPSGNVQQDLTEGHNFCFFPMERELKGIA